MTAIPLTLRNSQIEIPCQNYRIVPHLKSHQESQSRTEKESLLIEDDLNERAVCQASEHSDTTPLRSFMSMSSMNEEHNDLTITNSIQTRIFNLNFPQVFSYTPPVNKLSKEEKEKLLINKNLEAL